MHIAALFAVLAAPAPRLAVLELHDEARLAGQQVRWLTDSVLEQPCSVSGTAYS